MECAARAGPASHGSGGERAATTLGTGVRWLREVDGLWGEPRTERRKTLEGKKGRVPSSNLRSRE